MWLAPILNGYFSEGEESTSHLGRTRMRGYNLPTVIKLLEIHRGVPDHRMLRTWERDRPPGGHSSDRAF